MNKNAVVFGATGMVGRELVYELLESREFNLVTAVVRHTLPISHPRLRQVLVDKFPLSTNEPLLSGAAADVFFCCIGTTIKKTGSQAAFAAVDHDIPVEIARLAISNDVPNLVIISSIGADAASSGFYLRTKGLMEKDVMEIYKNGNLKILRSSLLMGSRDEFRIGEQIAVYVMKVLGWAMMGPLKKYKGVQSSVVARAMIEVLNLPKEKVFVASDEIHQYGKSGAAQQPGKHEVIRSVSG